MSAVLALKRNPPPSDTVSKPTPNPACCRARSSCSPSAASCPTASSPRPTPTLSVEIEVEGLAARNRRSCRPLPGEIVGIRQIF